jgi:hypothetical protein
MPYYFFDRAAHIDDLCELAYRLQLREKKYFTDEREWKGKPFQDTSLVLVVYYHKDTIDTPLLLNTPSDHTNQEVFDILQQYIKICKPSKITDVQGNICQNL